MAIDMFLTEIDMGLIGGPFVSEFCHSATADSYSLGTDGHSGVHQLAIIVVKVVLKADAISVLKRHTLVAEVILVGKDDKLELPVFYLGLVEHPLVEKQVIIAGGRHHKGDGPSFGTGYRFSGIVNRLVELVSALNYIVCSTSDFQVSLNCHKCGIR